MHEAHADHDVGLIAVGFSPIDRLGAIVRHLGWTGLVLSDPSRQLYRRLGIGRAPWWRVYSPGTLAVYGRAVAARQHLDRPDEDTRQLGGDAILVDGTVTTLWRPRSPDDRPPADEVLGAARSAANARS
ncbi:MAG: AhpC/TSA family protein [Acidimicrobiales bacterium]